LDGKICKIDHELVDLYNAKFGLRRLSSQKKSKRCPTRRQLQQVKKLTLNTNDPIDKQILDLLNKRKELQAQKDKCANQNKRILKYNKEF